MNEGQDNIKVVGTKVSIPTWRRFARILSKVGMTSYEAIQTFIDVFIRFGDDKHNLTPEMELMMSTFETQDRWGDTFNLADPSAHPDISEATYYLRDTDKKGVRVVHVERPFFGNWSETWNVKHILEKFLCLTFPQLYNRLRFLAVCRECKSILELLYSIVSELEAEENKAEFRKPFEDAERSEWGRKPNTQSYKIHHRKTVDDMVSSQLFINEDYDVPTDRDINEELSRGHVDDDDHDLFFENENEN